MKKRKDRKCVIKAHDLYISGVGYHISFVEDLQDARVYASHSAAKNSMGHYEYINLFKNHNIPEEDAQVVDIQLFEADDIKLYNNYYGES